MIWLKEQIDFVWVSDLREDPLFTLEAQTPVGQIVAMGEVRFEGRTVIAAGVHVHGVGFRANEFGIGALRAVAQALMREMDFDVLVVEGAVRTTGANPGARPRPLRFTRHTRP